MAIATRKLLNNSIIELCDDQIFLQNDKEKRKIRKIKLIRKSSTKNAFAFFKFILVFFCFLLKEIKQQLQELE